MNGPEFAESEERSENDQLESLLDEASDAEFGEPVFKDMNTENSNRVVLSDWTAREFASIYVRFKPYLERHARRYLSNPSQVEEVVQDAFLYLMTALPELDSEVGVLKFLKWKTKLLALDVIRSSSRVHLSSIDGQDFAAAQPELSEDLERADEAAIVSMALAKLSPRHRQVLIQSLYEEQSNEQISNTLGLSENATRQLLFRARAAFKKALIGEAEVEGLRVSEILSLAARKARANSKTMIGAAGVFVLMLASSILVAWQSPNVSLDAAPETTPRVEALPAPNPEPTEPQPVATSAPEEVTSNLQPEEVLPTAEQEVLETGESAAEISEPQVENPPARPTAPALDEQPSQGEIALPAAEPEPASQFTFGKASLTSIEFEASPKESANNVVPMNLVLLDSVGRQVFLKFDPSGTKAISDVSVAIVVDNVLYETISMFSGSVFADYDSRIFVFEGKVGYLVDADRNLLEDSTINNSTLRIQLDMDEDLTKILLYEVAFHANELSS